MDFLRMLMQMVSGQGWGGGSGGQMYAGGSPSFNEMQPPGGGGGLSDDVMRINRSGQETDASGNVLPGGTSVPNWNPQNPMASILAGMGLGGGGQWPGGATQFSGPSGGPSMGWWQQIGGNSPFLPSPSASVSMGPAPATPQPMPQSPGGPAQWGGGSQPGQMYAGGNPSFSEMGGPWMTTALGGSGGGGGPGVGGGRGGTRPPPGATYNTGGAGSYRPF